LEEVHHVPKGVEICPEGGGQGFVPKGEDAKTIVAASEVETAGALLMETHQCRMVPVRGDLILDKGKGVGPESLRSLQEQILIVGSGLEKNLQELEVGGEGLLRE
jgi:hypothetical protein